MKKLFSLKMLDGADIKSSLTQYVRCGCHEKAQFIENARQDWYRIIFYYSIC